MLQKYKSEPEKPSDVTADIIDDTIPEPDTSMQDELIENDMVNEKNLDDVDEILRDSFTEEELSGIENGLYSKDGPPIERKSSNFKHDI